MDNARLSASINEGMGFLSNRVKRNDLKAGDHIYTWRAALTYSHHGIYVGENKVVHFTQDSHWCFSSSSTFPSTCFTSSGSSLKTPCLDLPDCGFRKGGSGVVISCLECFLGTGSLYRFEYGVGLLTFIAKLRGTCTRAESNSPEAAVDRAMVLLHKGFGDFNLFENNCEDFALHCKGSDGSGQAKSFLRACSAAVIAVPLMLIVSGPVVLVAVCN